MKVVVYGATGNAGKLIVKELLKRNHSVTGVARHTEKLPDTIQKVKDDLSNVSQIAEIIKGADVVVSAISSPANDTETFAKLTQKLVDAIKIVNVPRLITVGGCGSLEYSPGVTVMDSGHWPAEYMPYAVAHAKALDVLKKSDINWTCLSPALIIENGETTGNYRLDLENLVIDDQGLSRITFEDYTLALVNELEVPKYERKRFTIGY
jgi:putative NADH-flavin reductase